MLRGNREQALLRQRTFKMLSLQVDVNFCNQVVAIRMNPLNDIFVIGRIYDPRVRSLERCASAVVFPSSKSKHRNVSCANVDQRRTRGQLIFRNIAPDKGEREQMWKKDCARFWRQDAVCD